MNSKQNINWTLIFNSLENWYKKISSLKEDSDPEQPRSDPSVSTVAQHYKRNPWAVLASTIISLRTKDEVTIVASERLLQKAPTPDRLAALKINVIEKLIYPAGFYHNKAKSLKQIAQILLSQYNGEVPSTMEELLALPGVGRKTANLVLSEAFNIDAICVDIHVHRISNRCGWLETKTPEETEMVLREILPVKYWKRINYLLVLYGQRICRPVSPFCSRCVIAKYCKCCGVNKKR